MESYPHSCPPQRRPPPHPLGPLTQFPVQKGDTITVTAPGTYPQPTATICIALVIEKFYITKRPA
jgi:hypothetical protein